MNRLRNPAAALLPVLLLAAIAAAGVSLLHLAPPDWAEACRRLHVAETLSGGAVLWGILWLFVWYQKLMTKGEHQEPQPRRFVFLALMPVIAGLISACMLLFLTDVQTADPNSIQRKLIVAGERSAITHPALLAKKDGAPVAAGPGVLEVNGIARLECDLCRAVDPGPKKEDTGGEHGDLLAWLRALVDWNPVATSSSGGDPPVSELWLFDGESVAAIDIQGKSTADALQHEFERAMPAAANAVPPEMRPPGLDALAQKIRDAAEPNVELTVLVLASGDVFSPPDNAAWESLASDSTARIVVVQLPSLPRAGWNRFTAHKTDVLAGRSVDHFLVEPAEAAAGRASLNLYHPAGQSFDDRSSAFWDEPQALDELRREYFAPDRFAAYESEAFQRAAERLRGALGVTVADENQLPSKWRVVIAALIIWAFFIALTATNYLDGQVLSWAGPTKIKCGVYRSARLVGLASILSIVCFHYLLYCCAAERLDFFGRPAFYIWTFVATRFVFCKTPLRTAAAVAAAPDSLFHEPRRWEPHTLRAVLATTFLAVPPLVALTSDSWWVNLSAAVGALLAAGETLRRIEVEEEPNAADHDLAPEQPRHVDENRWASPHCWVLVATAVAVIAALSSLGVCLHPADAGYRPFTVAATLAGVLLWTHLTWLLSKFNVI